MVKIQEKWKRCTTIPLFNKAAHLKIDMEIKTYMLSQRHGQEVKIALE